MSRAGAGAWAGLCGLLGWSGGLWAAEPPPRPVLPPEQVVALQAEAGRCVTAAALKRGARAPCSGVLVPAVELLGAQLELDHLGALEVRYAIDTAVGAAELSAAQRLERDCREELAVERTPGPLLERPALAFGAGVLGGALLAVGVAWALPVGGDAPGRGR